MHYDIILIGGGIVGVATAWQLSEKFPGKKILLLEKEPELALHQTGRNSGVLHAGVYYPPGSLKARFCKRGLNMTVRFCEQHDLPVLQCGKLIVATSKKEQQRLADLHQRCVQNELDVELLSTGQITELEPAITGLAAMRVSQTGIVNFRRVTEKMAELFRTNGGEIRHECRVKGLRESTTEVVVKTTQGDFTARFLLVCGGLMADRLARMMGVGDNFQIVPFRGEYFRLADKYNDLVSHLIYPIPDPALPFLGIHLTRMIDGYLTVGPNALQGWKREGYARRNFSLRDSAAMLGFPGYWKVLGTHWRAGLGELWRSSSRHAYLKRINRYCPQISANDLLPHPVGIRAQGVLRDGNLVHDFLFAETLRSLHVCNAPSPAATSAIPIAEYLCQKIEMRKIF